MQLPMVGWSESLPSALLTVSVAGTISFPRTSLADTAETALRRGPLGEPSPVLMRQGNKEQGAGMAEKSPADKKPGKSPAGKSTQRVIFADARSALAAADERLAQLTDPRQALAIANIRQSLAAADTRLAQIAEIAEISAS